MKPHVSKTRLEILAQFLDELPRKKFDFGQFGNGILKNEPSCKSVGCALGWATTMPIFKRLGLRGEVDAITNYSGERVTYDLVVKMFSGGQTLTYFDAAAQIFGITADEAELLFHHVRNGYVNGHAFESPSGNATPKQVAAHIRKFIKLKWP